MKLLQELLALEETTPNATKWIIHKKSRMGGGISGPTDRVFGKIKIKPTYDDKAEAEEHARIASQHNPVGYTVSPSTRSNVKEGAMKEALMDLIEYAVKHAPIGKASYPLALRIIAKFARENDSENILAHCSDEELKEYITSEFTEDDHASINESGETDSNWPKLIAHADEFRVELDEDEQCHLLDGEGSIRVSMPFIIWKQLCR